MECKEYFMATLKKLSCDSYGSPPLLSLADTGRKKRKRKDNAKKARKKLKMDTTDTFPDSAVITDNNERSTVKPTQVATHWTY